jgi:putative addiction module component (TIGR02574 family)
MTPTQPPAPPSGLTPELIAQVRALTPDERETLRDIMEDADRPADDLRVVRQEQRDEIARRIADIAAGRTQPLDAEDVLARLEAKYGRAAE